MANSRSSAKRNRQNERRNLQNKMIRGKVRTEIKKFLSAIENNDKEKAQSSLKNVDSLIDSAAGKGLYHQNTAARTKSRLHKKLNALSAEEKS